MPALRTGEGCGSCPGSQRDLARRDIPGINLPWVRSVNSETPQLGDHTMSTQSIQGPNRGPDWFGPETSLVPVVGRGGKMGCETSAEGVRRREVVSHSTGIYRPPSSQKATLPWIPTTTRRKIRFLRPILRAATFFADAFNSRRLLEPTR